MAIESQEAVSAAILKRLSEIRMRMDAAAKSVGRSTQDITLMAVTKTVPPKQVNVAVAAGVTYLGENRVQEFLSKRDAYDQRAEVQFIGHLQTNKVKQVVGKVTLIHSVDRESLLSEIAKAARQQDLIQDILLEVNIGGEASKSGVMPDELGALLEKAMECPDVRVRGLMTIPPRFETAAQAEECFARMQSLYQQMKITAPQLEILSMGMSGDYETAIRYGATIIRLGSALFGARVYPQPQL